MQYSGSWTTHSIITETSVSSAVYFKRTVLSISFTFYARTRSEILNPTFKTPRINALDADNLLGAVRPLPHQCTSNGSYDTH